MNDNKHEESASTLVQQVQMLHDQMMEIYTTEINALKIQVARLEEQNKNLHERLRRYED